MRPARLHSETPFKWPPVISYGKVMKLENYGLDKLIAATAMLALLAAVWLALNNEPLRVKANLAQPTTPAATDTPTATEPPIPDRGTAVATPPPTGDALPQMGIWGVGLVVFLLSLWGW